MNQKRKDAIKKMYFEARLATYMNYDSSNMYIYIKAINNLPKAYKAFIESRSKLELQEYAIDDLKLLNEFYDYRKEINK